MPWANNFGHLRVNFLCRLTNNLLYGFRNRNSRVLGNKLRSFLGKLIFWPNIFLVFGKKISTKGCQSFIRRVQLKALRIFFLKKQWFFVIFAPWGEKFHTFAENLRQGFQNINLSVQGNFLRNFFFSKLMVSYYFRFSSEKQRKLAKNLRRGFRNHNLNVQGNNLRKFF